MGSVQFSPSVVSDSLWPCIAARQASLSITNSQSSLKPMWIELVMPSSHLILCSPLLLLPPIFPSIRLFSNESTLHMSIGVSASASVLPMNTQDWLDLLADHRKSKRVPEKHLFLLYWHAKAFDCVDHNKLWKILKEMGIPDHLTCLLKNLYAGQEGMGTLPISGLMLRRHLQVSIS